MVVDCFTYNGELDILKLHLNILDEHVDKFIILEAKTTFSGLDKPLYFSQHEGLLRPFWKKIEYFIIDEDYTDAEWAQAEHSPNTKGAYHWKREFLQKEAVHKALKYHQIENMDTVYIGDVDEIWQPYKGIGKLKLLVYAYYLNNLSNEEFWGTFTAPYGFIKGKCLNHLRSDIQYRTKDTHGWHFTSMGGLKEVRRKLNDSYTTESYNTPEVQEHLESRVSQGTDYLGRSFDFRVNTSHWPLYLKDRAKKYAYLCK